MRKFFGFGFLAVVLAVFFYGLDQIWGRLMYDTGGYNTPGTPHNYNFNSGIGGIFQTVALQVLSALAILWWRNQCHVSGCYWPRLPHKTEAGDFACWRHHPESKLTKELLHTRHHGAKSSDSKLDEIHRHVQAMSPTAGNFDPPKAADNVD